jgi:hypothetical protein
MDLALYRGCMREVAWLLATAYMIKCDMTAGWCAESTATTHNQGGCSGYLQVACDPWLVESCPLPYLVTKPTATAAAAGVSI